MPRRAYLVFESRNPQTFHCLIGLLEGEPITLRPRIKACIPLIEGKRNAPMKARHSKSDSADTTTDDGDMGIIIRVDGWRIVRSDQSRPFAIRAYAYMPFWPNWWLSCITGFFVLKELFLIKTLCFFGDFLDFSPGSMTLGADGPMV